MYIYICVYTIYIIYINYSKSKKKNVFEKHFRNIVFQFHYSTFIDILTSAIITSLLYRM